MTWVITANTNHCKIYQYDKSHKKLTLIQEIDHPENKLNNKDTTSDRPGKYQAVNGTHTGRGAYEQPTSPKDIKIDNFSREVAQLLYAGFNHQSYDSLILVMPSQLYGMMHPHLHQSVEKLITHNIHKNVMSFSDTELLEYIHENTKLK